MKILSVDSTTILGGAGLVEGDPETQTITSFCEIPYNKTHGLGTGGQSQFLLPAVDHLLKETKTSLDQIDLLAVVNGPGSFTGIRVGVATLKGLFHHEEVPVVEVLSLDAMALAQTQTGEESALMESKLLCPVIDARMGEIYAALYQHGEQIAGPWALSPEELIQKCGKTPSGETPFLFGTGFKPYQSIWENHNWSGGEFTANSTVSAAAQLAMTAHHAGKTKNITELKPFYLRESEAERQWKRRHD